MDEITEAMIENKLMSDGDLDGKRSKGLAQLHNNKV
jgi:hypothetical protein